jgi:hypothetical protein
VGVGESVSQFQTHERNFGFAHDTVTVQDAAQSAANWKLGYEVGPTGLFAPVIDAEYVGVV